MQASYSSKQCLILIQYINLSQDFTSWFSFFLWVTHGFSFSADYSQLSFTVSNVLMNVLELLIFNKLSCLIIDTISASIFK